MSKNIKKMLVEAAPSPDAATKDAFLREHRRKALGRDTSTMGMIWAQLGFVSIWVWIVTTIVMVLAIACVSTRSEDLRDMISSMMPFVSCLAVFQTFRSKKAGMFELEQATIHSGCRIMLARISGIGLIQLLCIAMVTILLAVGLKRDIIETGYALIIPYLLNSVVSMEVEYRMNYRATWVSVGVAVIISAFVQIFLTDPGVVSRISGQVWILFVIVLCFLQVYEIYKLYKLEELSWN